MPGLALLPPALWLPLARLPRRDCEPPSAGEWLLVGRGSSSQPPPLLRRQPTSGRAASKLSRRVRITHDAVAAHGSVLQSFQKCPLPSSPMTYLVGRPLVTVSDDGRVRHTPFEGNFDFSGSVPVAETAKRATSRIFIFSPASLCDPTTASVAARNRRHASTASIDRDWRLLARCKRVVERNLRVVKPRRAFRSVT